MAEDGEKGSFSHREWGYPEDKAGLSRRDFITVSTAAAAGLVTGASHANHRREGRKARSPDFYEPFVEPPVQYSRAGVLNTTLRVVERDVKIREPGGIRTERTRCYNGLVPGPTWKIRPGDEIRVTLINDLAGNAGSNCADSHVNGPHCFNTTNLHTHGLHVSPGGGADNSFLKIEPSTQAAYCIRLPESHPPGTFWYHPHRHGSTALQVMNGMAGALIVEAPGAQQIAPPARDLVWIIQEIAGKFAEKLYTCQHQDLPYTVNGKFQPTLRLRPGEIQRWRFINATATPGGYTTLQLLDQNDGRLPMSLIAVDGYDLAEMQEKTEYVLPPGGRADFLIQAPASGRYKVMKRRFQGNAKDQVLGWIEVAGAPVRMTKPRSLPPPGAHFESIKDDEIKRRRTIRFQMCPDQAQGETCKGFPAAKPCSMLGPSDVIKTAFLIDGKPYDVDRIDHTVELGTAEEWEVVNETGAEHPFHIHTNHFQAAVGADWMWRDTISIPANGSVKIRLRFVDYAGRLPLHCHILLHSDMGMMQNVEVVGHGVEPCKPLSSIG